MPESGGKSEMNPQDIEPEIRQLESMGLSFHGNPKTPIKAMTPIPTPRTDAGKFIVQGGEVIAASTCADIEQQLSTALQTITDLENQLADTKFMSDQHKNAAHILADKVADLQKKVGELERDSQRLLALIAVTENEGNNGKFKVSLEYDNYQDGALIRDATGKLLASCYATNPSPPPESDKEPSIAECEWQFRTAIDNLTNGVKSI